MISSKIKDFLELNPEGRYKLLNSLAEKGINPKILDVMNLVPREYFLNKQLYDLAYEDRALPINSNQTISQPYTVAFMTDLLDIKKGNRTLEIGTGSGYQSIILSYCGAEVFTIERIELLYNYSKSAFIDFGIEINTFLGDGSLGLPEFAPFDRIIVTAGAPEIPDILIQQLNIGGILVIPVGNKNTQKMLKIKKKDKTNFTVTEENYFKFVPLIGKNAWEIDDE